MRLLPILAIVGFSSSAWAVTPSSRDVKKVTDYFLSGKKQGPILTDFSACLTVEKSKKSSRRYECTKTAPAKVKVGTAVSAWSSWLVPQNGLYDDVMIQFVHDGIVRNTMDVKLNEGFRKRAYRTKVLNKVGQWKINIMRNRKILATTNLSVVK